jgi:protein involved in polysaccharide export with SLBB domain
MPQTLRDETYVHVVGGHSCVERLLHFRRPVQGHEKALLPNRLPRLHLDKCFSSGRLSMASASGAGMFFTSTHKGPFGSRSVIQRASLATLLVASALRSAAAQGYQTMQPMATRSDLSALSDRLARGSESDRARASELRTRLRDGDFHPGDRIGLVIEGSVTQSDTIPVIAGSKVNLKDIGDVSLAGVLRSELQDKMAATISKYIKEARVRATPLVRLSILGPVGKPGYYFMPPDIPVTEAIMRAGGPAGTADLKKTVIRRGTEELYDSRSARSALDRGLTLDQLSLRDGDSIEVGTESKRGLAQIGAIVGLATSIIWALSYARR